MDEIELVIKIPKEMVQELKDGCFGLKHTLYDLAGVICNGIVLPKGHGRLIDADKLLETWYDNFCEFMTQTELDSMNNIIKNADTIIEADKN